MLISETFKSTSDYKKNTCKKHLSNLPYYNFKRIILLINGCVGMNIWSYFVKVIKFSCFTIYSILNHLKTLQSNKSSRIYLKILFIQIFKKKICSLFIRHTCLCYILITWYKDFYTNKINWILTRRIILQRVFLVNWQFHDTFLYQGNHVFRLTVLVK